MNRKALRAFASLAATATSALVDASCVHPLPARAQLVITVDTDAPPAFVDRLRIDVYDEAGSKLVQSRDFALLNPEDWPLSFGLRAELDGAQDGFLLRLRAYRTARAARSETGVEPDAISSIDRIVHARTPSDGVWRLPIVLRADCIGVVADLAAGKTCVDRPNVLDPVGLAALEPFDANAPRTRVPPWQDAGPIACTGVARDESGVLDEDICIPGGAFFLGEQYATGEGCPPPGCDALPERLVVLSPFFLDRYEVSVGRLRAAMLDKTRPFVPPDVTTPHNPKGKTDGFDSLYCTYRGLDAPADPALDALPVNCTTYETAQAFCAWAGGALPSEAQWEYAAAKAYKPFESTFPWGDVEPTCDRAAYARYTPPNGYCEELSGTTRVDRPFTIVGEYPPCTGAGCGRDETPGPPGTGGIVGMAGNVLEWVRDLRASYKAPCWSNAPRRDPVCLDSPGEPPMIRGGGWVLTTSESQVALRTGGGPNLDIGIAFGLVGFRCMRPDAGGASR